MSVVERATDEVAELRESVAELADLIRMVAANSHTAYFQHVERTCDRIINRLTGPRSGGDECG